jgi:CO dehydrogenase maturation factor
MKIAFAGKTTLSSLFTRHLAEQGLPVVAIDADINQHLAEAVGAAADPPPMGAHLPEIKEYLRGSNDVAVVLAGNKVQTDEDVAFLRQQTGDALVTWFGYEPAVRAMEQGRGFSLADLTGKTRAGLAVLHDALDAQPRDWQMYARQATESHLKNARGWASAAAGQDLTAQVDPDFTLGPHAAAAIACLSRTHVPGPDR